jgi:hypothetical protein
MAAEIEDIFDRELLTRNHCLAGGSGSFLTRAADV